MAIVTSQDPLMQPMGMRAATIRAAVIANFISLFGGTTGKIGNKGKRKCFSSNTVKPRKTVSAFARFLADLFILDSHKYMPSDWSLF